MDYFSLEKLELYLPVCELLQVRSGILLVSEGVKNSCLFNQIAVTEDKYNLMDVLPFLEEMGGDISLYNDESSLLKREFELELKYLNALVNSSVSTTSFDVNETERLKILLKELGLSWKIKEPFNFSYLPGVVERRRNIYVARDEETVQKLSLAHGDDYLFGRLLGILLLLLMLMLIRIFMKLLLSHFLIGLDFLIIII